MPIATFLLWLLILALAPAAARAQNSPSIEVMACAFQAEHHIPGLVIGLTTADGDTILRYGVTATSGTSVDGDTRFEIGSITKVLTGLALAETATRGEVDLDDPISRHLPRVIGAPQHDGVEPTLRQLSRHTSGLPRLPGNLDLVDMADPYAAYTTEKMFAFLAGYDLPRAPGAEYEYSNLGAGLLGHLLAARVGTSFRAMLATRVLEPMGMTDTYMAASDTADHRMARGHAAGEPVPYWQMGPLAGAGAGRSTPRDMLRFLRLQIDPSGHGLEDAIRLSQRAGEPLMPNVAMALGWHVTRLPHGTLYWHNGGTGGFRGFVGFIPEQGLGLVILANSAVPLESLDRFAIGLIMAQAES